MDPEANEKYNSGNAGAIAVSLYKATDTLTNSDVSMCHDCANKYATSKVRANAGYLEGIQPSKITHPDQPSDNLTGVRGVYYDSRSGRYRARITFKGKRYNLCSFLSKEDAIKARQKGEEEIFAPFLERVEKNK